MKKCAYAACFFAALLFGCADTTKTVSSDPAALPEQGQKQDDKQWLDTQMREMDKRWVMANEWLAALADVADKTKDARAHEILDMLTERGIIALPTETGLWIPNVVNDTDSIRIVILVPSDAKYELWKKYIEENSNAAFAPKHRALILKNIIPMSRVFSGIILAHEGNHALTFLKNPQKTWTKEEVCEEERDTHEFENRLFAKSGGAAYKRFVSLEAARLAGNIKQKKGGISFPSSGKYDKALENIFGNALSDYEKGRRNEQVWIDIVFRAIDASDTGNKEKLKAGFLCAVYENNGLMPK